MKLTQMCAFIPVRTKKFGKNRIELQWGRTQKKGRLRCHKRPKSREETPKEGNDSGSYRIPLARRSRSAAQLDVRDHGPIRRFMALALKADHFRTRRRPVTGPHITSASPSTSRFEIRRAPPASPVVSASRQSRQTRPTRPVQQNQIHFTRNDHPPCDVRLTENACAASRLHPGRSDRSRRMMR
jgi:hypothetical protein